MAKADSVHSTPPTNTSVTRRSLLGTAAGAAAALASTGASPMAASPAPDPIYAAIEAFRRADASCVAVNGDIPDDVGDCWSEAISVVMRTRPTTPAGLAALTSWARERADWLRANGTEGGDDFCTVSASIDDATRGMSGLEPWSPPLLAAVPTSSPAMPVADAELLALVDEYIAAETEVDRLNDAVNAMEEVFLRGPGKKPLPAPRGYQVAKREMQKANKRVRKLEEQIIDTSAASMAGVIAKARCVEKNLCDGKSASYDPDAQFAASMAKDLLALEPAPGRGKAVA